MQRQALGVLARCALGGVLACAAIAASASAARAVSPVLNCVDDNLNGTYTAHFGYNNTNTMTVTIAVGSNNKFIPDPQNRGQPSTFSPGLQNFVFSVVWDGSSLAWFLDSHTVTASTSSTRCATPTATATATATPTSSATATATASVTATVTATASVTATPTDTNTPQATSTATATLPATATATATAVATNTDTATPLPTSTPTATDTAAATATATETATSTPTDTDTPAATATNTDTATPAATATATASDTVTPAATATMTATASAIATATDTTTPAATSTATATASATAAATGTGTPTVTPTATSASLCAQTPVSGCATPVGFKKPLRFNLKRQLATWRWRTTGNIPVTEFGSPLTTTSYSLCIYAGTPATLVSELRAPAGGTCKAGRPCWKARPAKGFRYKDLDATPDGVTRLVLRTAVGHLADLALKARGPNIQFPPLPLDEPVIAQLVKSEGPECWQSNYSAPPVKNTSQSYKDKND